MSRGSLTLLLSRVARLFRSGVMNLGDRRGHLQGVRHGWRGTGSEGGGNVSGRGVDLLMGQTSGVM